MIIECGIISAVVTVPDVYKFNNKTTAGRHNKQQL